MDNSAVVIPKKKGRKPKSYYSNLLLDNSSVVLKNNSSNINIDSSGVKIPKKRGRKPKGGKLINIKSIYTTDNISQNVILHLNCKKTDLKYSYKYDPDIKNIENFNFDKTEFASISFDFSNNTNTNNNIMNIMNIMNNNNNNNNTNNNIMNNNDNNIMNNNDNNIMNNNDNNFMNNNDNNTNSKLFFNNKQNLNNNKENLNNITENLTNNNNNNNNNNNIKDNKNLYKKLNILEHNLNKGISKKGACFWCTCDFNNDSVFIPKNYINDTYNVYGNFCSPSCASGYLFNENIDTSCKFERYFLLNNLYGNNKNFNRNIVPSPEPFYILDKFNGNLTIDEYRKLNDNNKYILLIKKPISKILPELFEDNYEFKTNNKYLFNN